MQIEYKSRYYGDHNVGDYRCKKSGFIPKCGRNKNHKCLIKPHSILELSSNNINDNTISKKERYKLIKSSTINYNSLVELKDLNSDEVFYYYIKGREMLRTGYYIFFDGTKRIKRSIDIDDDNYKSIDINNPIAQLLLYKKIGDKIKIYDIGKEVIVSSLSNNL